MFDHSSVYVLSPEDKVYRLELDSKLQASICANFAASVNLLVQGKQEHVFSANYKPEDDEFLIIENFLLPDAIKEAIKNPLGVTAYKKDPDMGEDCEKDFAKFPDIKALFVGEHVQQDETERFNIAFQRYRREQNIVTLPFRLFFSNDTFKQDKRFGIGISSIVDCYFTGNKLQFNSFFFARQIFDLSNYYRSATEADVTDFINNTKLEFENAKSFMSFTKSYVRRKITMIKDSLVLEKYTANQIRDLAADMNVNIAIKNDKIVVPSNKEDALLVVGFLDEEAYRGPFSQDLLLANSKRVIRKGK